MNHDVAEFIQKCTSCQKNKIINSHVKAPMVITTNSLKPFEKIFIDVVGPLPRTHLNHAYILTLQDDPKNFPWAVAINK